MKKLFALMLALCLMLGCTALADTDISWEQVAPLLEANGVTGQWYTFEQIAVAIFIPDGLAPAELPDESYIGYFAAEDGSAVAVQYVNVDGMDLETYAAALPDAGATGIEAGTVNGLPCVSYDLAESNAMCVAFTTQMGYILEAVVAPVADDNAKLAASVILASIQAVEAE
jgi:hypothetical protein